MAALQNAPISLQSKIPPTARLSGTISSQKPLSLSFSATFPSLSISTATNSRGRGGAYGARMSATAASSYAAALVDIARSNSTLEATAADVDKIEKLFEGPELLVFFLNPTISIEKKREVVDEIAKETELQPHTSNFLNILIDAKRIEIVREIVKEFEIVYNRLTDTELATVTSVVKLESQHLAQIAKQVQKLTGAKNVRIKTLIDPSLVAGFTIRYGQSGSKLIDLSVKKQLEEIASQIDLGDIQLAA
ncbi:ATP synthase subunit delta, chloroplastic-like [Euphorbia lathyris]|uniref:ATP synthase subunit delta, chloroplastic-like n=1 Tax=Euphorbia lathyris TaxID=212925 RepID=UPI003313E8D2